MIMIYARSLQSSWIIIADYNSEINNKWLTYHVVIPIIGVYNTFLIAVSQSS